MPFEKNLTRIIPKMYKWNAENNALFIFVKAQQQLVPTIRIEQAIKNFIRLMDIDEDEWPYQSMCATYTRLQKEYYNGCKGEINTN